MSSKIIASPLAGKTVGSLGQDFIIAEWQDAGAPPGPPRWIAPLHLHHKDDEAWYVLEGKLQVRVGDEIHEAGAGCAVFVPRGTAHTYWNPDPAPVRYLLIMTSNIYALVQGIHSLPERSAAALKTLFEKHDSVLL
ncbi:MAG: cupin domain-containing protein [Acidobacteria bacterium]|nr:cupin domain-containing protein [Acidobacteriota bacterium]